MRALHLQVNTVFNICNQHDFCMYVQCSVHDVKHSCLVWEQEGALVCLLVFPPTQTVMLEPCVRRL